MKADEKIEVTAGFTLSSLAPWVYLKDAWQIPGDFSLSALKDRKAYDVLRVDPVRARKNGVVHR